MNRPKPSIGLVVALVVGICVAAGVSSCGDGATSPGASVSPSASSPTPSPSSPTPSPSSSATPGPSSATPGPSSPVPAKPSPSVSRTLSGVLEEGVEPGCIVLSTPEGYFQLIGPGVKEVPAGSRVTVTGTERPDILTTCQQGPVLQVTAIERG